MSTIEQLLDVIVDEARHKPEWNTMIYPAWTTTHKRLLNVALGQIIDPWNAAVKAMESVAALYDDRGGTWFCYGCHSGEYFQPEDHNPDNCCVAECQAALAEMKGKPDGDS